jgi:MFS family permease
MQTRTFWLMLVAVAVGAGGITAVFTHVVPMLTDHGVALGTATAVMAIFGLVGGGWQIFTGHLLDRLGTPRLIVPMFAAAIAGVLLLQFGTGTPILLLAGVLLGIGIGAEYAALPYFISRYFGLRHYGSIVGAVYAVVILVQGLTPGLMDMIYDRTGSYDDAVIAIAAALGVGILLLGLLPSFNATEADCGMPQPA